MKVQKIIISISIIFLASITAFSQSSKGNYNFLDFQQKPYYFGITLAFNSADFKYYQSKRFVGNDEFRRIESVVGPGFNIGMITNLKIGNYFDIRFLPTLSFAERKIEYSEIKSIDKPSTRRIESVFIEFPFHVRYKSEPYHDFRLFVISGIKYSFDVASDSRSRQADELVQVSPSDFSLEVGAGIQFFMPFFIFSPEFKVSHGLGNVLLYDNNLPESSILEKLLSRSFTISLHFEG